MNRDLNATLDQTTDGLVKLINDMNAMGASPNTIRAQVRFHIGLAMNETKMVCLDAVQTASSSIQKLDWEPHRQWTPRNKGVQS